MCSAAPAERKGVKNTIWYWNNDASAAPANISNFHLFNFQKNLKHSEWFGGGSKNALKEIELPQLLSQILAAAAGPLSRMALGNEQDGNARLFNLILNTYLKKALKIQTLVKTVHPTFHLVIVKKIMFF